MEEKRIYDLEERLISFAEMIGKVCHQLESNREGRTLGNQLIRSGTSPALNYAEALVAQSTPDFIYKLSICLKELKESEVAMKIIQIRRLCTDKQTLANAIGESSELVAIFIASVNTARENLKSQS